MGYPAGTLTDWRNKRDHPVLDGELHISEKAEGIVSVFDADETAHGATLEGVKYPLSDYPMTSDYPIGVSNEFTGISSRIALREGALLVMACKRTPIWIIH